ncbi:MAG: hypothetical protein IKS83_01840 [Victivallales bacterium]|nr:hypothetical protein [Victivallales bacterium]
MSPKLEYAFSEQGRLISLRCQGLEFASADDGALFLAQLRDLVGNPVELCATDFAQVACEALSDGGTILRFSDCKKVRGTTAEVTVRRINPAEICWGIRIDLGMDTLQVEWIDFPRVRIRHEQGGKLLLPINEGTLLDDPQIREHTWLQPSYAEYPMTGVSGFYPGPVAAQFEAYYRDEKGLCVICPDAAHAPKTVDARAENSEAIRLMLQHFTSGQSELPYEVRFIAFEGDWQNAAELYRAWMEENDHTLPKPLVERLPKWLADSPVVVAYSVRGHGPDSGTMAPNEYFPYEAALPTLQRYREAWGGPLLALLMHWEGTAPWAPPYVWPPYGGEELLRDYAKKLHAQGDALGLYCSGIGWTQRSNIDPTYDCQRKFQELHVDREVCAGPRGERYSRVCNGYNTIRIGYDLCASRPFTHDTVKHEVASAAQAGVDYLQYFDQNQGCASPLCYSHDHGHPALPGPWHTDAMRELLADAQTAANSTVLGCENAAAEPYLGVCQLNDLRSHLAWGCGGVPVPLYSYLFHEYTSGFSGNCVCLAAWVDVERTPDFLLWHLAWHFVAGNLLTVVLKDGGDIHWCWSRDWSESFPEQAPIIQLVKNLARWRREHPELVAGRMVKCPKVECANVVIHRVEMPDLAAPAVLASAWQKADGNRVVILANTTRKEQPCTVEGHPGTIVVPPLDASLLITK